jgi:hypothetical protein
LRKPPEGDPYARKQKGKDLENSLGLSRNRKTGDGYIAIDYLNKTETGKRLGQTDKRPNGHQHPSMQEGQGQREGAGPARNHHGRPEGRKFHQFLSSITGYDYLYE